MMTQLKCCLSTTFPSLYVVEKTDNKMVMSAENAEGYVEYKRDLKNCTIQKCQKYATQMRWRISENTKKSTATYYIGVDDNGEVRGLAESDVVETINVFLTIAGLIDASVVVVELIWVKEMVVIKAKVKIKNICNNYLVDI